MGFQARKNLRNVLAGLIAGALMSVVLPGTASATHYPSGANCYDCHTVSKTRMVVGTRMIKDSTKTAQFQIDALNRWNPGNPVPCVFCHEAHAVTSWGVAGAGGDEMVPVDEIFGNTALSKHRVNPISSTANNPSKFDCVDCHTRATTYVVNDGNGNANVHGINAATQNYTAQQSYDPDNDGTPNDSVQETCVSTACHGFTADRSFGDRTAKKQHPVQGITINGGAAPANCIACHDKHGSYGSESLVTLRADGTASSDPANTTPYVQAGQCGFCHSKDDGGATSDFMARGHGGNTYLGNIGTGGDTIGFGCSSCHNSAMPHDFYTNVTDATTYFNKMRFSMPVGSFDSVRRVGLESICTKCHDGVSVHNQSGLQAGCVDCHEPHGEGLNNGGGYNIKMVRARPDYDRDGTTRDVIVYNTSNKHDTAVNYDDWPNNTAGYDYPPDGQPQSSNGLCDNYDCHGANVKDIWPFTSKRPTHTGGNSVTQDSNCGSCHSHDDGWKSTSCANCHGNPPRTNAAVDSSYFDIMADNVGAVGVHKTHAAPSADGGLGMSCSHCHYANVHNESSWTQNLGIPVPPANVDVAFDPAENPAATYLGDKTCSNLTCHNPDTKKNLRGGVGITNGPKWTDGPITVCSGCHVAATGTDTHVKHEAKYPCATCHNDNIIDANANLYPAIHADGSLQRDGSLVSMDLTKASIYIAGSTTFTNANKNCSGVYCHGGTPELSASLGSNNTPQWGTPTTGACGTCHSAANPGTRRHSAHIASSYGPKAACGDCHTPSSNARHVNASVSFADNTQVQFHEIDTDTTVTECNTCHNGAASTAKLYWEGVTDGIWLANGGYCEHCHDANASTVNTLAGTGGTNITAPNVMGNETTYGAGVRGHGKTVGTHDDGKPAANKACTVCHNATNNLHINGTADNTFVSMRFNGTINGRAVATVVENACKACHQGGMGNQVSSHGNTSYNAANQHDPNAEGFTYRCDACHDVHGMVLNSNGQPNLYMVKANVEVRNYSTPASGSDQTTVQAMIFESKTGANSYDDGATQANNICVGCHTSASRPGSTSAMTNTDGNHSELQEFKLNEQSKNCISCHTHDYDQNVTTADGFMPFQCNGCHSYPGLPFLANTHLLSSSHDVHIGRPNGSVLLNKGYTCDTCHNGADHNTSGLVDPVNWGATVNETHVQIRFNALNATAAATNGTATVDAGAFNEANNTCASLYCHGADTTTFPIGDQGSNPIPDWDLAATANCGSCHKYTSGTPPAHLAHTKHAGSNYAIGCQVCHNSVTTDGVTIRGDATGWTNHANGSATVAFDAANLKIGATSAYTGDAVIGSGYGVCNNTYCHSNGTDLVKPFTYTSTLAWNQTGNCFNCHGDNVANSVPAYPNGTPKANAHVKHVTTDGYNCQVCHYATTTISGSITTYSNHINGTFDVIADLTNPVLDNFTYTAGSCTAECHGGNSLTWATTGPISCDICHAEVAPGVATNVDVNNFDWDGTTQSKVSASEYSGLGHGLPAGANKACAACHTSSAPHVRTAGLNGPNPYRLIDQDTTAAGTQFTCSTATGCHVSGTMGTYTAQDISTFVSHTSAAMTAAGGTPKYAWSFAPGCVNCHDPHGDATNVAMIQKEVYDKAAFGLPAGPSPAMPTEQLNLAYTDTTSGQSSAGSSYADSDAPFSAICQECHEGPGTTYAFVDNTNASVGAHPASSDCSVCHKHDSAFKPSGCFGCHGDVVSKRYWPDGANTAGDNGNPDNSGAHEIHMAKLSQKVFTQTIAQLLADVNTDSRQKQLCEYCHAAVLNDDGHGLNANLPAEVYVSLMSGTPTRFAKTFWNTADGDASYSIVAYTCSATDCHDNNVSPSWYFAPQTAPTGNSACIACHDNVTTNNPGTTGETHTAHMASSATFGRVIACADCHDSQTNWATTTPPSSGHINGTFSVVGNLITLGKYAGTYPATPGSCGVNLCHNNGLSTINVNGSTVRAYTWKTALANDCQSCHNFGTLSSNAHGDHMTYLAAIPETGAVACANCHAPATAATHLNGSVSITGTVTYSGNVSVDDGGVFGSCSTGSCHNSVTNINWNVAATSCNQCHASASDTENFSSIDKSISFVRTTGGWDTTGHGRTGTTYRSGNPQGNFASCTVRCHSMSVSHNNANNPFRLRTNGGLVDFQDVGMPHDDNTVCLDCHSTGGDIDGSASLHVNKNHYGAKHLVGTAGGNFCWDCHDPHGDGNDYMMQATVTMVSDNLFGIPATTRSYAGFDVATGGYTSSDLANGSFNGLCQTCHTSTLNYNQGLFTPLASHHGADTNRCTNCHLHTESFGGKCYTCHGDGVAGVWPDGTGSGDRDGKHTSHVTRIAEVLYATPTPDIDQKNSTCGYCHVGGAHSGDTVVPAELGGFRQINAVVDADGTATQSGGNVTCTVNCHFNKQPALADWYGTPTVGCNYCHEDETTYDATASNALPNAHRKHVDETGDGGYNYACSVCHNVTGYQMDHQNGVVNTSVAGVPHETAANATITGGDGAMKMGGAGSYSTCNNFYCHGDRTGGNTAAPVWNLTAACGTCHGSIAGGTNILKSYPRTNAFAPSHQAHVVSNSNPGCSACHEDPSGNVGEGTYGNEAAHVNGTVNLVFGSAKGETVGVSYEALTAVYNGTVNGVGEVSDTCSNVKCHNGSVAPRFDSALGNILCGDCHGVAPDPRPQRVGETSSIGSHLAHANADTDYSDCANCHGNGVDIVTSYSATGGQSIHQDLVVNFRMNGTAGTYTDASAGGVNYVVAAGDHIDNGTCFTTSCHGGSTPVWGSGPLASSCGACHSGAEASAPSQVSDRSPNMLNMTQYTDTGHGLASGQYDLDALNAGGGNAAANLAMGANGAGCHQCHDSASNHVPKAATDPYRLGVTYAQNVNGLCINGSNGACHHDTQLSNTIGHHQTYSPVGDYYFEAKCVDCHDPHGDSNMFMIHGSVAVDGTDADSTASAVNPLRLSNTYGTPDKTMNVIFVADTDGSNFADTTAPYNNGTGICEVCHDATSWYSSASKPAAQGPQSGHSTGVCTSCHAHKDGFKGGACNACHGYPPVDPADTTDNAVPPDENYVGGGGPHKQHVDMIVDNTGVLMSDWPTKVVCGPCHGDNAGSVNHNDSNKGPATWLVADVRPYINIEARTASAWGASPTYAGLNMPVGFPNSISNRIPANAMDIADSRCRNADCHGTPATFDTTVNISWSLASSTTPDRETDVVGATGGNATDAPERTKICGTCHDLSPAAIRLYNASDALVYSNTNYKGVVDAAANYFGTVSGYGRGGHGDPKLQTEDPFVNSDPSHVSPIDCTACHDPSVKHVPSPAANSNRLISTIEDSGHTAAGICNDCHAGADYPGTAPNYAHHPSYVTMVAGWLATQEIGTNVSNATTWTVNGNGDYNQNAYGAGGSVTGLNFYGNPDKFIDWYNRGGSWVPFNAENHTQDDPRPVFIRENGDSATATPSRATLPLDQNVYGTGSVTNRIICTTCHNPHGTDLYIYDDQGGVGKTIADHNMLRLYDRNNTLCNGCH